MATFIREEIGILSAAQVRAQGFTYHKPVGVPAKADGEAQSEHARFDCLSPRAVLVIENVPTGFH